MSATMSHNTPPDLPEAIRILLIGVALFLLLLLVAGCAPQEIVRTETVEVLVPVATPCPAPPGVRRPALPLAALDSTSAPADVMRAYVSSAWLLAGYAEELEILLDAYRSEEEK